MFIDVTRYGGLRILRLAVAAIAYLDETDGGSAIHLIGGETMRVNEDPAEVELRCMLDAEAGKPMPVAIEQRRAPARSKAA
ncbi:hypothetical protein [Sphingomonas sp. BE137]|uniref:hypothetical protein n=1 Tax=Sphingomonas sp. BE137 TaxID=2817844 RepID=UPI001AE3FAF4|nr:hypothetical protein [Sphingomonas sp. BE137]MDR6850382.1 hypothetical protein [Sphingomonas sp. BE137]